MIETDRLIVRDWRSDDAGDFHKVCGDPEVMAFLGPVKTPEQTAEVIADLQDRAGRFGHTFWALERKQDSRVIGFCGLVLCKVAPHDGRLEIGWRLAKDCWGKGYAREAAEACIAWSSIERPGEDIIAITSTGNVRSQTLMKRLGMNHMPELDFDHPLVAKGDPLRPHVTYVKEMD